MICVLFAVVLFHSSETRAIESPLATVNRIDEQPIVLSAYKEAQPLTLGENEEQPPNFGGGSRGRKREVNGNKEEQALTARKKTKNKH